MEVMRISAQDTYSIRQSMLRPNGTLLDCRFNGDDEDLTFHLGACVDKKLVSVASLYFENHPNFKELVQYRLRGMATLSDYQGKGLSFALLQAAFPIIKQNQGQRLWCNARLGAVGFYKKIGLIPTGEIFNFLDIGPHYLMSCKII